MHFNTSRRNPLKGHGPLEVVAISRFPVMIFSEKSLEI